MRDIKMVSSLLLVGFMVFFSCCDTAKIVKRYKKISFIKTNEPNEYVDVRGFCLPISSLSSSKTIFDLLERGQKELIEQIGENSNKSKEIYAQLSEPFVRRSKPVSNINDTEFKKRIVLSVSNLLGENGANRIESLSISLDIPDSNKSKIEFLYWDKIVTEYQEIDLGKLNFSRTGTFSFTPYTDLTGTIKGNTTTAASLSSTYGEEVSVKKKMASLTGTITEHMLEISRYSAPLEDINGNIVIEVKMRVENSAVKDFFEISGLFRNNKPVIDTSINRVKRLIHKFPDLSADESKVSINYNYKYRSVVKGASSFTESDDSVVMIEGNVQNSSSFNLLTQNEIERNFWTITYNDSKLSIKGVSEAFPVTLLFSSYEKANEFLRWLNETKLTVIDSNKLFLGLEALKNDQLSSLKVVIDND